MRITKLFRANSLKQAAAVVRAGGTVAFRTETVYGLGADATNDSAVVKIFDAKQRPAANPLIVHFYSLAHLFEFFPNSDDGIVGLLRRMGQAFTIVLPLPAGSIIAKSVTAGQGTVAVRVPQCRLARRFIRECGVPLAAPSANTSTRPSPTRWTDVYDDLDGRIDGIIMSRPTKVGLESTVVAPIADAEGKLVGLKILRPGGVNLPKLAKKSGLRVELCESAKEKAASPGTCFRHYTPSVPLVVMEDVEGIRRLAKTDDGVILCLAKNRKKYGGLATVCMGNSARHVQKKLFAAMRDCEKNYSLIIIEQMPNTDEFASIRERLEKASEKPPTPDS